VVSGLAIDDLSFSYGATPILRGITLPVIPAGEITGVIGPNAAGKTTFFKCIAGLLTGRGRVSLDGVDLATLSAVERAKRVTYLPQDVSAPAVLTVVESVLLARQHSISWRVSDEDLEVVGRILDDVRIAPLALRYLNELSGGQRQLVSIAQSLARAPRLLLMDEPTSNLDLQHQLEVLEFMRQVTAERRMMTLIAVHDLNLAARYADRLIVLTGGGVYAAGAPAEVLTPAMLREVYGVHATVAPGPDGHPQVTPHASIRQRELVPG
jgi:iron complex transport system ATP-binding protein